MELAQKEGPAPAVFTAELDTTTPGGAPGKILVEIHRDWAPLGADRFYQLIKSNFFKDARAFRVVPNFVVQWGISGNPVVQQAYRGSAANIRDDPVKQSNSEGTLSFATSGPNTRSTQLFINLSDNANLDGMGFAPIGKVVGGMDVVKNMYSGYGESPDQSRIQTEGNKYLQSSYPKLTSFASTSIVGGAASGAQVQPAPMSQPQQWHAH